MGIPKRIYDALILEDFDIVELYKYCPEQEVGVSVSSIYMMLGSKAHEVTLKI